MIPPDPHCCQYILGGGVGHAYDSDHDFERIPIVNHKMFNLQLFFVNSHSGSTIGSCHSAATSITLYSINVMASNPQGRLLSHWSNFLWGSAVIGLSLSSRVTV